MVWKDEDNLSQSACHLGGRGWGVGLELGDFSLSQGVAGEVSPWPHVSAVWCKDAGEASPLQRHRSRTPSALTAGREGPHYCGLCP